MTNRRDEPERPGPIAETIVLDGREPLTFLGIGIGVRDGEEKTATVPPSPVASHALFMSRLPISRAALPSLPSFPPPPPPPIGGRAVAAPALVRFMDSGPAPATPIPTAYKNIATQLFREQALRAYEGEERLSTALRATSPSIWVAVLCTFTVLIAAGAVCAICRIDQVGDGAGIIRPPGGARSIAARAAGRIGEILVKPGTLIEKGTVIATIDSTELRAQRLEADGKVELARRALERFQSEDAALFQEHVRQVQREQELTRRQLQSQMQSQLSASAREDALRELSDRGVAAKSSEDEALERLREIDRAHLGLQQQLAQADLNLATLRRERAREEGQLESALSSALASRSALAIVQGTTDVVATEDGRIESIAVHPGELIQLGTPLATVVPATPPSEVIAFIPDRDRAFVLPGSRARVELNQLPSAEFGSLEGHVKSVATAFASPEEMRAVLPELRVDGPSYRVEIVLDEVNAHTRSMMRQLQSETLVTVHVVTRSRRILALLFEPLKQYLEAQ